MTNWMLQVFLLLTLTSGFLYFSPFNGKKNGDKPSGSGEIRITERYVTELQSDLKRVDTEIVQTQTKLKDLGKEKKSIVKLLKSLTHNSEEKIDLNVTNLATIAEVAESVEQIARQISTAGEALAFQVKEAGKDRELIVNGDVFVRLSNGRPSVSRDGSDAFYKAAQLVRGPSSMKKLVIVSREAEAGRLERLQKFADALVGVRDLEVDIDLQNADPQKPNLEMVIGFGAQ